MDIQVYFSDYFRVRKGALDSYGAFDISLVRDLPLFIDPFLLFYPGTDSPSVHHELHDEMIRYLIFLRDVSQTPSPLKSMEHLFRFPEVRQTWLGFSTRGNHGRGLGADWARALHRNLGSVFRDFGEETVSHGSHLEKLTLIKSGIGRDMVSDFVTNLIRGYLAEYTQGFADAFLGGKYVKIHAVERVRFDYGRGVWRPGKYRLPSIGGDYVLLTPRNLLTKDSTWINRCEFLDDLLAVPEALPNEALRTLFAEFIQTAIAEASKVREPSRKDYENAVDQFIKQFPQVLDYYVLYKEETGQEAVERAKKRVELSDTVYVGQASALIGLLAATEFYSLRPDTLTEARQRILYMKHVIEDRGGWRYFYVEDKPIRREDDLQIMYMLTWYGSVSDLSREVNDGMGPADFKASQGAQDKSIVEMKLASNSKLLSNLRRQVPAYQRASDADTGYTVIVFFTDEELERVNQALQDSGRVLDKDVFLVDARPKTSASQLK